MKPITTSRLPAILIGGPPHAGKSVLAHALKEALYQAGVQCYLLRAAPDGEGDWYLEAPADVAEAERRKGSFSQAWTDFMCRDIARRPLPFLVDVGGKPKEGQDTIFAQCSHAILLVKDEDSGATWQRYVEKYKLEVLAILTSKPDGLAVLESNQPYLQGTITGLQRREPVAGLVFEALCQRVQALLAYTPEELVNVHWRQAPTDMVVDIATMYQHLHPHRPELRWEPQDLDQVFGYLPQDESLALYGRGPGWLYAAIASFCAPQPFYQFDARLGWVEPVELMVTPTTDPSLIITTEQTKQYLHIRLEIVEDYLEYRPQMKLSLPSVPQNMGVILNGRLPNWLYTGLTLFYYQCAWVAVYYPHLNAAIIVSTHDGDGEYSVGQTVAMSGD